MTETTASEATLVSRRCHIWTLLIISITTFVIVSRNSELWVSASAKFTTISGSITIYSIIFSIIETIRLHNTAVLLSNRTEKIRKNFEKITHIKEISSIENTINQTILSLTNLKSFSHQQLLDIHKTYIYINSETIKSDTSKERKNSATIESFISGNSKLTISSAQKLKLVLVEIKRDLTSKLPSHMDATK